MPSTAFETLLDATVNERSKEITDQMLEGQPIIKAIKQKGGVKPWTAGGEKIEEIVKKGRNATIAARDYKTPIPVEESDPTKMVSIGRRYVNGSMIIYKAQIEANSSSKTRIFDLVEFYLNDLKDSLKRGVALELWSDGTQQSLSGLPAIISASNTYMDVDRSIIGNEWWRAKTGAAFTWDGYTFGPWNTAEPLVLIGGTDGGLSKGYDDCTDNGGTDFPDIIATSYPMFTKLKALFESNKMVIQQNEKMRDLGYPDNFQYRGAAIVWDRNCTLDGTWTDNPVIFINTDYLKIRPYMEYAKDIYVGPPVDLFAKEGVLGWKRPVQWGGNFTCTKPGSCGALTGKTV